MSSLEEVRNLEANAAADQFLAGFSSDIRDEKIREQIRKIVIDKIQFTKTIEELGFLRNFFAIDLFPIEKSKKATIDLVFKKLGGIDLKAQESCIRKLNKAIENGKLMIGLCEGYLQMIKTISPLVTKYSTFFDLPSPLAEFSQEINSMLNEIAPDFEKVTVEEWKAIQQIFEDKKLPFSHDFVQRCQQVAFKALAA